MSILIPSKQSLNKLYKSLTSAEIAKSLDVSTSTVNRWRRKYGIPNKSRIKSRRTCNKCKHEGPKKDFATYTRNNKLYHHNQCIPCFKKDTSLRTWAWRIKNIDEIREKDALDKWIKYQKDPNYREKRKKTERDRYHKRKKKP
jgi:hypothetical protein